MIPNHLVRVQILVHLPKFIDSRIAQSGLERFSDKEEAVRFTQVQILLRLPIFWGISVMANTGDCRSPNTSSILVYLANINQDASSRT